MKNLEQMVSESVDYGVRKFTWRHRIRAIGRGILVTVGVGLLGMGTGAYLAVNNPLPLPTPAPGIDRRSEASGGKENEEIWNISAYCPCEKCCGEYSKGKHYRQTANGYRIKPGDKLVAAPPEIPFGTVLEIPGYGRAVVKDRGGAIKGRKLDLYFDSHSEALKWGRQHLPVTFLK